MATLREMDFGRLKGVGRLIEIEAIEKPSLLIAGI